MQLRKTNPTNDLPKTNAKNKPSDEEKLMELYIVIKEVSVL